MPKITMSKDTKKKKSLKKERIEKNHLKDNFEAPRMVYSNPPQIDYSIFVKTTEEKLQLATAKKAWNDRMRAKYPSFTKRAWGKGDNHLTFKQIGL